MTGASEHATDPVFSAEVAALEGAGTLPAPNLLGDGESGCCLVPTRSSARILPHQALKSQAEAPATGREG